MPQFYNTVSTFERLISVVICRGWLVSTGSLRYPHYDIPKVTTKVLMRVPMVPKVHVVPNLPNHFCVIAIKHSRLLPQP